MDPIAADTLLADLAGRARALRGRVAVAALALRPDQLLWHPAPDRWCIAQVAEHLLVADSIYNERIRETLGRAGASGASRRGSVWRPTLAGRFLVAMVRPGNPRRLPAPAIFAPAITPRPDVVASYLSGVEELEGLMRAAAGRELRRPRFGSPVTPLLRLNLGDAFVLLVTHGERHAGQIERVRAAAGFPV